MLFTIEKDAVKVSTFLLLADVREGIGENTGSSGGSTGGGSGEVTIDLSNYYKKIETYSRKEIDAQFKEIAKDLKSLKLVAGDNNTIKLMMGNIELSRLVISGGTVEKPVYGNLIFDNSFVKIKENGSANIGVKLDAKPNQNQTITIIEDSDILSVNKTSLTFTPNNYNTYQYVTITVGSIDTSETVNIKFINSDELLTESNASIYAVADEDEYNVNTTFPSGAYTVTMVAFLLICLFQYLAPSMANLWDGRVLCYALAGSFVVFLIFASLWWERAWIFIAITGIIWAGALSVFVTFHTISGAAVVFALAGVLELPVVLCYFWRCAAKHQWLIPYPFPRKK